MERLITKSFKRLLDKGIHRGFITYEELGKSLGKRHFSQQNVESAFVHIFDNKISLVEKKSDYSAIKKRDSLSSDSQKAKDVDKIATLPTLDEARAKIVGILSTPAQKILSILLAPGSKIAILAHAKSKKT